MRLIAHNMLKCNKKGVVKGYPLKIECTDKQIISTSFNIEIMKKIIYKIHLEGLKSAIEDLNLLNIEEIDNLEKNINILKLYYNESHNDISCVEDSTLKTLHHILFEIHVIDGALICPETGRRFLIKNSIPNMLLHEDEV